MRKRIVSSILILVMVMMAFTSVAMAATDKGTGLYKDNGQWKYYQDGKFTKTTGLVQRPDNKTWHYVENGVYKKVTGLVQCVQPGSSKGKWYYVYKGDLNNDATGLVQCVQPGESSGQWYYVENGKRSKETGLVKCIQPKSSSKGSWYYVKKGKRNDATGVVQCIQPGDSSLGNFYYVENGKLKKVTGVYTLVGGNGSKNPNDVFLIKNGKHNSSYYGAYSTKSTNYYMVDGRATEIISKVKSGSTSTTKYTLNRSSDLYHRPSCKWVKQMSSANRWDVISFKSIIENAGYRACKTCKP